VRPYPSGRRVCGCLRARALPQARMRVCAARTLVCCTRRIDRVPRNGLGQCAAAPEGTDRAPPSCLTYASQRSPYCTYCTAATEGPPQWPSTCPAGKPRALTNRKTRKTFSARDVDFSTVARAASPRNDIVTFNVRGRCRRSNSS